ncbi:MAG: glycosyltransferase family 2 protein [Fuerstiella sp.]|nr:glycosyltransferase family 2 protein [Fuerstiella sp.]
MSYRTLIAIPVYNEVSHVTAVLDQVKHYADEILVVNDGSDDGTAELLATIGGITVMDHPENLGYGAALATSFKHAVLGGFDVLVTMDCDGQHQPQLLQRIAEQVFSDEDPYDMVSGSRYLQPFSENTNAPEERRRINRQITACLNEELNLSITDAFCGFKAYRVSSLQDLEITVPGYAMPLQLWVQIADLGWKIAEFPVPLVYVDETRSFGGALDQAEERMAYYRTVLNGELERRGMTQRFTADCGKASS